MRNKHIHLAIAITASILVFLTLASDKSYASQPPMGTKGNSYLDVVRTAKTLKPDSIMLVWVDINATINYPKQYGLPADPSLYGIRPMAITYAPDIDESRVFWCLTAIQPPAAENMIKIPWVFDIKLIRVGGLSNQASVNSKLSLGVQEAIDRAMLHKGALQTILYMQNSSGAPLRTLRGEKGISSQVVQNVTATMEKAGGRLLRDYYEGSYTLLSTIPTNSIMKVAENPFVGKLYLNGPVVPEGFDNTEHLYGFHKTPSGTNHYLFGLVVFGVSIGLSVAVESEKKMKKKALVALALTLVFSLTFFSQTTPAVQALDVSTPAVRATDVWAAGNTGGGINVAIIDLGFDVNHNDIAPAIVHTINAHNWSNVVGGNEQHGTHVAGIVAGRGINNIIYRGVAWGAGLVLVKVEGDGDFEPAIRWVINNRAQFNIRVITMSLRLVNVAPGGDGLESPASIAMDDAVETGLVTIKSAGNIGDQGPNTVTSPGNAFNIITVGAVNDMNTGNINDDEFALYPNGYTYKGIPYPGWGSSRGPTGDGRPKPDVVAPGVHIWSCRAAGVPRRDYEDVTVDGFYGELSGTSMATPHVAGTVALMLNANPNLAPAQVKAILRQTARLNTNLTGFTVNDRGYGIIDALGAVQLAQNVGNIQRGQMYDSWDLSTPGRDLGWWCYDYLTFRVDPASSSWGISLCDIQYHYRHPLGIGNTDYELVHRMFVNHVWLDNTYYDLGTNMNAYLFSAPRIYERGGGYFLMRALYRVGTVNIEYQWKMNVDEFWQRLTFSAGPAWRTIHYIDTDVWDSTNYAYLPSTGETLLNERAIYGDVLLDIRDPNHSEYLQLDPLSTDNPIMWVLRYGYFGNNPASALNNEYIYDRDIVVYYQASSYYPDPGPASGRHTNPAVTPNTQQNDAYSGADAGNNFNQATSVYPSSYNGILCYSSPEDMQDWYKFAAQEGEAIHVSLWLPAGIDFDLQLYDPAGNLKAASYLGPGSTDSVSYTADSSGDWRAKIYINSGEAKYSFYMSVGTSSGGGGCPILYVYDGKDYVSEGLLDIHDPDGIDVVTKHTLITTPKRVDNEYLIQLIEHPQTISHIDHVQLFAILKDKTLLALPLTSAIHSKDGDVLPQLLLSDDLKTDALGANHNNGVSQSIALRFEALSPSIQAVGFVFLIEGNNMILKE